MNIVVTGATSFIGVPVVERLLTQGHQVYAIVRPNSANTIRLSIQHPGLHRIYMEMQQLDAICEVIQVSCDGFLHFGWDGSGSDNRTNRKIQQKNVADSLNALKGAHSLGCKRFIFSGSQAEYGFSRGIMSEDTPCNPISEYGIAKVDFCRLAQELCKHWYEEDHGSAMEYIHTRIFSIYGPGDHPWSLVESCIGAFTTGQDLSLGECTQLWNFLYVDDLVQALLTLLFYSNNLTTGSTAYTGIYNLAGANQETRPLREYVERIYESCGRLGSYTYGNRAPNAEGPASLIPDITKITELTGWKPQIAFREGIQNILNIKNRQR